MTAAGADLSEASGRERVFEVVIPEWEFTDHTADTGLLGRGGSPGAAIAAAGAGLFDLMVGHGSIRELRRRDVSVAGYDLTDLLVAFLNELLYLFEVEREVFARFDVAVSPTGDSLSAVGYGERLDPARHTVRIGVKAATHHAAAVEQVKLAGGEHWVARTSLDV
jgi:SHS2 domain-containing protein